MSESSVPPTSTPPIEKSLPARLRGVLLGRVRTSKAQSFVELALILPILLVMFLGMVEAVIFMGRYLDLLDLTREAARFASVRDPFAAVGDSNCSTPDSFNFYYDVACIFSPPASSSSCTDPNFCNGLNPFVSLDPAVDDVVVSVFTISNNTVSNSWPSPNGYWALSNNDSDPSHVNNWTMDCHGTQVRTQPIYTDDEVNAAMASGAQTSKAYVAVEFYYCYHMVLNVPFMQLFLKDPVRINAYTLMSIPAAAPSPSPKP